MTEYFPTTKENTFIKVLTYYDKGGLNVFTYQEKQRGYYVTVVPVEKHGNLESFTAFTGVSVLLLPVSRASAKQAQRAETIARETARTRAEYVAHKNGYELSYT